MLAVQRRPGPHRAPKEKPGPVAPGVDLPGLEPQAEPNVFVAADYFQVNLTALHGLAGQRISLDITGP